jgi:hypothetical protein
MIEVVLLSIPLAFCAAAYRSRVLRGDYYKAERYTIAALLMLGFLLFRILRRLGILYVLFDIPPGRDRD